MPSKIVSQHVPHRLAHRVDAADAVHQVSAFIVILRLNCRLVCGDDEIEAFIGAAFCKFQVYSCRGTSEDGELLGGHGRALDVALTKLNRSPGHPFLSNVKRPIGQLLWLCIDHGNLRSILDLDVFWFKPAATELRKLGGSVQAVEADLATTEGVDKLCVAVGDRPIDALLANAGVGLGKAFLDQDFRRIRNVVDTNITGTLYLIHRAANEMLRQKSGRILITGSIAGFTPGSFQAVYNGSKAFLDSFSFALREELRDSGITVTCLMPGATETSSSAAPI